MKTQKQQSKIKIDLSLDEMVNIAIGVKKSPVVKLNNKLMTFNLQAINYYNELLSLGKIQLNDSTPVVLLHHNDKIILIPFYIIQEVPHQLKDFIKNLTPSYASYKGQKNLNGYRISVSSFFKNGNESYDLLGELGEVGGREAIIFNMTKTN
jgi:hypothetical protein